MGIFTRLLRKKVPEPARQSVERLATLADPLAQAQGTEWKTLNDEVKSVHRQGSYDRAVVAAKEALQVAEQALGPDHPDMAASLNNLAELHSAKGDYAQAEPL